MRYTIQDLKDNPNLVVHCTTSEQGNNITRALYEGRDEKSKYGHSQDFIKDISKCDSSYIVWCNNSTYSSHSWNMFKDLQDNQIVVEYKDIIDLNEDNNSFMSMFIDSEKDFIQLN